ncbi:hypothetical protein L1887_59483 [Cichorium endivia]|nr:hypothetical protein L1887_59483 [Cichorium endivia]
MLLEASLELPCPPIAAQSLRKSTTELKDERRSLLITTNDRKMLACLPDRPGTASSVSLSHISGSEVIEPSVEQVTHPPLARCDLPHRDYVGDMVGDPIEFRVEDEHRELVTPLAKHP